MFSRGEGAGAARSRPKDDRASVAGDLRRLDRSGAEILREIERRLGNPARGGTPLSGQFAGLLRLRVEDYRVIYARRGTGFLVLRIAHRGEVYWRRDAAA